MFLATPPRAPALGEGRTKAFGSRERSCILDTAGKKRLNHCRGDFLGIGTHAFFNNPVVAGHDQDGLVIYGGLKGFLDTAKLFGNLMQPPEGPGGHHQL